jgi:hypothetical protein
MTENRLAKVSRRAMAGAVVFAALSLAAVAAAILTPLPSQEAGGSGQVPQRVPAMQPPHKSWEDLQARIAQEVQEMIRPLQGIAAVKDDGAAAKMAARLQLQGIVNMGGQLVAYVSVDKGSAVAIKTGGTILEFSVLRVEERTVTLCREGVQVVLP